jgi:MoaA/NifB/PqqE/SkfB family radical SAM enzyme
VENLDVNIGRRCNLRCAFCLDGGLTRAQRQWVPLARAREEVQLGAQQGCRSLGLLGGEPTVYPHLFELLGFARELGYERMALYTNGFALGEPALVDRLVAAGVTRIGVSLHGHHARLEERLTGRAGSFEGKVAGLRRLVAHHRRGRLPDGLAVNPVINRLNLPHLAHIARLCERLGVPDLRFNFLRSIGRAAGSRELTPRYRDAARAAVQLVARNEARRRRGRRPLTLTFGDFPFCLWPWEILGNPTLRERTIGEFHDLRTDVALIGKPRQGGEPRQDTAEPGAAAAAAQGREPGAAAAAAQGREPGDAAAAAQGREPGDAAAAAQGREPGDAAAAAQGREPTVADVADESADEDLQRFNWADRRKAELKVKFPACRGCAFDRWCEGVYRCYVEIHGEREFGAVSAQGTRIRRHAARKP